MDDHSLDTKALSFSIKLLATLCLVFGAAYYGTDSVATTWLLGNTPNLAAGETAPESYRLLAGVSHIGQQRLLTKVTSSDEYVDLVSHAPQTGLFVGIDTEKLVVKLYQDTKLQATLPILKLWNEGSHWEASAGDYEVVKKETNHYSKVGDIMLPYAVHFFGNFMIHGWPYSRAGEQVDSSYEGGGIRLASEDAQKLFTFVDIDTPVYVNNSFSEIPEQIDSLELQKAVAPRLSALSYLIADLQTGEVLVAKNEGVVRPVASITKLMTAIVANETIPAEELVKVSYQNKYYSASDLRYPLLLRSDNTIANTLAGHVGRDTFMQWMNQKSEGLGMANTHFADPSGLSPENVSTSLDLFRLARYLYIDSAHILAVSKESEKTIYSKSGYRWEMDNQNRFAGDAYFVGGKLGFTDEAKKTGLSILAIPIENEIRIVAVVILGSNDWITDTNKLISWLERSVL